MPPPPKKNNESVFNTATFHNKRLIHMTYIIRYLKFLLISITNTHGITVDK